MKKVTNRYCLRCQHDTKHKVKYGADYLRFTCLICGKESTMTKELLSICRDI
jgi:ribosomal protein L44E